MAWFSSANLHFVYFHQIVLGKELKRDNLWWWMLTWCNVFSHIYWSRNFRYLNFRVPSYIHICSKIWPYFMILNILIASQSFFKIFFYDLSHQKKVVFMHFKSLNLFLVLQIFFIWENSSFSFLRKYSFFSVLCPSFLIIVYKSCYLFKMLVGLFLIL